ncbi:Rz1-like lysis system protein LysC [Necropsobacter rosorum]|uniref:Rz1-like lysis system protein LysC n=1 Tax=Necropsobacter rosorum TaxID=908285 RepID=UPI003C7B1736
MYCNNIKTGAILMCLMISAGCSTNEKIPVKQPLLCPQTDNCRQITVSIQKNRDFATALDKSLNQTDLCVLENTALKKCIADFNQSIETK